MHESIKEFENYLNEYVRSDPGNRSTTLAEKHVWPKTYFS